MIDKVASAVKSLFLLLALNILLIGCSSMEGKTGDLISLGQQAEAAYTEKRCEQAIELYSQLAEQLPEDTHSLLRIGNCYARSEQPMAAVKAYQQAIERDPGFTKGWYNLSYMQAQMLGKTVAGMAANIDTSDPSLAAIRALASTVLVAFEAPATSTRPSPLPANASPANANLVNPVPE